MFKNIINYLFIIILSYNSLYPEYEGQELYFESLYNHTSNNNEFQNHNHTESSKEIICKDFNIFINPQLNLCFFFINVSTSVHITDVDINNKKWQPPKTFPY